MTGGFIMAKEIGSENVVKGVDKAMWAWIVENSPVTLPTCVEVGVERAFDRWLDANKAELLEKIAEKVAKRMGNDKP
jgi:hypothetical protein